jgi:chromosomal replication initiation ATPase DnaA
MQLSLKEAWTRILDDARREIPEKDFKAWVEPAKPVALESDRLILGVPDEFAVQWNEAKNSGLFARLTLRAHWRTRISYAADLSPSQSQADQPSRFPSPDGRPLGPRGAFAPS